MELKDWHINQGVNIILILKKCVGCKEPVGLMSLILQMSDKLAHVFVSMKLSQQKMWRVVRYITQGRFRILFVALCAVYLLLPEYDAYADAAKNLVHHDLKVNIIPKEHVIEVQDRITLPEGFPKEFTFSLHSGLQPKTETQGVILKKEEGHGASFAESYRVTLPKGQRTFGLNYKGIINHPLENVGKEEARGFSSTPGIISEEGVFLAGSSFWYPTIDDRLLSFTLDIGLPPAWDAVSQGERTSQSTGKWRGACAVGFS